MVVGTVTISLFARFMALQQADTRYTANCKHIQEKVEGHNIFSDLLKFGAHTICQDKLHLNQMIRS